MEQEKVPIFIAASHPKSARIAGSLGDGFISTKPDTELVRTFEEEGGFGKPKYAELTVCWAGDEEGA